MALPPNEQDPQLPKSVPRFENHHLENSFEYNGVAGQQVLDLLALEDDVLQRCLLSAAGPHSASEVQQRQVCSPPP